MYSGHSSPFTGLIKYFPINTPVFSFVSSVLSIMLSFLVFLIYLTTSFSYLVPETSSITSGCSGARTKYVTPKIVSIRVVNVEIVLSLLLRKTNKSPI